MALNVVEILVKARNMTEEGFAGAEASGTAFGESMQKIGLLAAGGLAVVGAVSVDMAAKFDSAMTRLQTQAGVSASKLAVLKSGVLELASQTGFGPENLAESMYHVASNMQSVGATAPQMLNAVKVAAEGAKVGGANLVDVTNALTAAIASGIPGVKNFQQAMGMLNATVGSGDMKMQDLAEAFSGGMVATVKGFGLSLKDVGAALATFGDNNIRGARAGTQLRMSVMALAVPTMEGAAQLQKWGMSANSLATDMRQGGLLKALDDLHDHFVKTGITAKEQGDVITQMFGKKAGAGLNVLMDQLDRLKSKYPDITKGADTFGKAWGTTQKTFTQQLDRMGAGLEALGITIGNKLLPPIQAFVSLLLAHQSVMLDVAKAVGVLAAGLAVYAVAAKVAAVVTALLDTEFALNPFGLAAIAIAALVAGVIYAYTHFKTFRDVVADVGHFFASVWTAAVRAAGAVIQWFVSGPLVWIRQQVAVLTTFWRQHGQEIEQVARAVWTFVSTYIKVEFTVIETIFKVAFAILKAVWDVGWAVIRDTTRTILNVIGQVIHAALQYITGIIGIALDLMTGHWGKAWRDARTLASEGMHDVVNIIKTIASGFGNLLYDAGKALVGGLVNGIKSSIGAVGSAVSSIASEIKAFLPSSPAKKGPLAGRGDPLFSGQQIAQRLAAGMTAGLPGVTGASAAMAGGSMAGVGAAAGGGGGGMNVTVNVPPTANLAEVGRQIALALGEYKKRGGWVYKPAGF